MTDSNALTDASAKQEAPHPTERAVANVRLLVGDMLKTVARALPTGSRTDAERFCQIAMTAILANLAETQTAADSADVRNKDEYIRSRALVFASPNSLRRVIAQAAELDLQPGSALGYCWFIRRAESATFMVGVNGYTQLLLRHPDISKIHADVIFEADEFEVIRGEKPILVHKPAWTKQPHVALDKHGRGERLGAYAVVTFKDGATDFCLMNAWDLERAHSKSSAPNSPAYRDWPEEMDQRSAIKRGQKRWPKSLEFQRAVEMDESDSLREDLAGMIETVETAGTALGGQQPQVSKQRSVLDDISRSLPSRSLSAAEQMGSTRVAEGAASGK